ncbi:tyrosine-type recombinase/integrase [Streptomyces carpinensis]|uniref:Site-specific integrase n=1 Tax=Streptomyces carpinensis TaxID=66369 RepID=A0ABV1WBG5_9ACTN|nr:site-specific integrase [Streptomyces carpinensis]
MASVVRRKNKAGETTSFQVKWRDGGSKTGDWQTERFDDEESANVFKQAVDEAGQNWPPGWVKGQGYINETSADELRYRFDHFARESVEHRTASDRYKRQRIRALEMYIFPTFGLCDVRSAEHFSKATIGSWVNKMLATKVRRGSKIKDMSPETLRGLHGLLSSILKEAVIAEPPLRDRNPCDLTRLPTADDRGIDDNESSDDMEFMTPEEVAGLVECFPWASDRMLVRLAYGTGLRWGEISALAARHARNPRPGEYEVRVVRAWKRRVYAPWYLGPPKTKAGRRTVEITAGLWQELQEYGLAKLGSDELIFHNGEGDRLKYATFWERWGRAVKRAKARGLLPEWKHPTFHDLRHSHVAALLSDGHSLTYVQRRLGHESIKTTSDRYGHLLETAHKAALVTIDRVMGFVSPAAVAPPEIRSGGDCKRAVHVAYLGSRQIGFWDLGHAEGTAERWVRERGGSVHIETTTSDGWVGAFGGGAGPESALKAVRSQMPRRTWVWRAGPVAYAADGSEVVTHPGAGELDGRWVWDFEDGYTQEPAHGSAEWRRGSEAETAAWAWGCDEEAVRAAYANARAEALRICGQHPDRAARGREPVT